jgi:hypothetical protein
VDTTLRLWSPVQAADLKWYLGKVVTWIAGFFRKRERLITRAAGVVEERKDYIGYRMTKDAQHRHPKESATARSAKQQANV